MMLLPATGDDSQESLDRFATKQCGCPGGRVEKRRDEARMRLRSIISGERGKKYGMKPLNPAVGDALVMLYSLHTEGLLTRATINDRSMWINFYALEDGGVKLEQHFKFTEEI
jgi:hypothetical protein